MTPTLPKTYDNVFRVHVYDFSPEMRERNWNIYNMRVLENRTLEHIGQKHGLSRERVRQIVERGRRMMKVRKWIRGENRKMAEAAVGSLELNTRLRNALERKLGPEWWKLNILLFCGVTCRAEMLSWPGLGKRSVNELQTLLEKVDSHAAHLWTTRNWQNNNPPKHGRSGPRNRRKS